MVEVEDLEEEEIVPRPRRCRKVGFNPSITYFKPAGVRICDLETVEITIEEIEALRLQNIEGLDQETAAGKMNISQPTLHRTLISARKKITDALVNGKAIQISKKEE